MVSPWDAERSRPGIWNSGPDDESSEFQTPDAPTLDDETDFPTPPSDGEDGNGSGPTPPSFSPELEAQKKQKWSGAASRNSPSVPLALLAVALVVGTIVFFGLRVVRVSVSGEETAIEQPQDAQGADESASSAPGDGVITSTTTLDLTDSSTSTEPDWNEVARSVVFFEVDGGCGWVGSGTLILDGSYVLTNWHVSGGGECPLRVGLTESFTVPPRDFYKAKVVVWDSQIDLAIVRLVDSSGNPFVPPGRRAIPFATSEAKLGDTVRLIGYPVLREESRDGARYTLTLTQGVVSGTEDFGQRSGYNPTDSRSSDYEVWGEYIKHTAEQNGGVSGGGAFNTRGELVAVPTAGRTADNPDDLPRLELMRSIRFAKVLVDQVR